MKRHGLNKGRIIAALTAFAGSFCFAIPAFACMSNTERMDDFLQHCVICQFVELLLDTSNTVITESYNILSGATGPAINLLGLGLAFWLAWHIGQYFINYKYSDPMEFVSEMGRGCFRAMIIAMFLAVGTAGIVFDTFISPVISGFTGFIFALLGDEQMINYNAEGITNYCAIALHGSPEVSGTGKALSDQVIASFLCMVQAVYLEVAKGMAIGLGLQCHSLGAINFFILRLPDVGMWCIGTIIFLVFLFIVFAVSFRLVDFFIRIAFVFVVLPMLMVAWVFPITRKYTKKGWDLFLNSLVGLVAVSVAMLIIVHLCGAALGDSDRIDYFFNNDMYSDMYDYIYREGIDFILFVALLFISVMLCKTCIAIANHFVPVNADLGASNVGASVGGKMAAVAANTVQAITTLAKVAIVVATAGVGSVGVAASTAAKEGAKMVAKTAAKSAAQTVKQAASKAAKTAGKKTFEAAKKVPGKAVEKTKEAAKNAEQEGTAAQGDNINKSNIGKLGNNGGDAADRVKEAMKSAPKPDADKK